MNTRKFVYMLAGTAIWCLAISGCQTNPTTEELNSPSTTSQKPSPTSSSNSTHPGQPLPERKYQAASKTSPALNVPVPKFPKEAGQNTSAGAKAFVDFYFELINYVIETNDTQVIRKYTNRTCKACGDSIIDPAEYSKAAKEWIVGGEYTAEVIDSHMTSKKSALVTTSFKSDPLAIYLSPNKLSRKYSEVEPSLGTFQLEYKSGWRVVDLLVEEVRP